jgi:nucleoside-diphosphate-sugar epimerase
VSAGPDAGDDPVLSRCAGALGARGDQFSWIGYLSTTGVYGDRGGDWVDETSPCTPTSERGKWRVAAEQEWLGYWHDTGLPVHIFRLAGIYGPGRGPFAKLRAGTARRIVKAAQVFSRIHVEDIATVLEASIARPHPGAIYNVCDDEAAPPEDVIAHAAKLLGLPVPPAEAFDEAEMSPMARSFYAESKRVSNARIKSELRVKLTYPTYREGLAALLAEETG